MPKHSKAEDLLKVLGQRTPAAAQPAPRPHSAQARRAEAQPGRANRPEKPQRPKGVRGTRVQFYLHEPDLKLIRELKVWFAPHRNRINDSIVVKAALRAAKTGPLLLAAYDDAVAVDGRSAANRKKAQ